MSGNPAALHCTSDRTSPDLSPSVDAGVLEMGSVGVRIRIAALRAGAWLAEP
jgi:hypothetical protein